MKISKFKLTFISLCLLFLLDSCTLTKRKYNKGFDIDWFNGKKEKNPIAHSKNKRIETPRKRVPQADIGSQKTSHANMIGAIANIRDTASSKIKTTVELIENSNDIKDKKLQVRLNADHTSRNNLKLIKKLKSVPQLKESTINKPQKTNEYNSNRGIGILLLVIGILSFIMVSILLGVLLIILGIIIMSRSKKVSKSALTPEKEAAEKEITYIDVVYLKNGSILKGLILEQTPNVSLKIQTNGGSIFIYKMEEIEKIIKEPKN